MDREKRKICVHLRTRFCSVEIIFKLSAGTAETAETAGVNPAARACISREDAFDDLALDVGQAVVTALEAVR